MGIRSHTYLDLWKEQNETFNNLETPYDADE